MIRKYMSQTDVREHGQVKSIPPLNFFKVRGITVKPYQVPQTNDATLIASFITLISADVLSPGRFKSFFLSFTFSDLKLN